MRKILLFSTLFILAFSINGNAQNGDNTKGIRAGWQTSNIYNEDVSSGDPLSSFYVGFLKENKIVPMLHFGTGLEYFQNGFVRDSVDSKYILHTLSIPVLLKFKIGPVYATGGASANFKVGQTFQLNGVKTEIPEDSKANWFDVPLHLGIGVEIFVLRIEARYHWGMIDTYANIPGWKAQYFQLGASVAF